MEFGISTPALLFPTISLILLAFTQRFLALAALVRDLKKQYENNKDKRLLKEIKSIHFRIKIIRNMQAFGVSSIFLCVLTMFFILFEQNLIAKYIFVTSLISLLISLGLSFLEIQLSINALKLALSDLEDLK